MNLCTPGEHRTSVRCRYGEIRVRKGIKRKIAYVTDDGTEVEEGQPKERRRKGRKQSDMLYGCYTRVYGMEHRKQVEQLCRTEDRYHSMTQGREKGMRIPGWHEESRTTELGS